MEKPNRCYNCKFWCTKDTGYSNWTVEETIVHCLKEHFEPVEESYSWKRTDDESCDDFFKKAETCKDFKLFGDTRKIK
jgi:hypothetical protein